MVEVLYRAAAPGFPQLYRVRVTRAGESFYRAVGELYAFDDVAEFELKSRLHATMNDRGPAEFDCRVAIFSTDTSANGLQITMLVTDVKQMRFGADKLRDPDDFRAQSYEPLFLDSNWIEWMMLKEVEVEVERIVEVEKIVVKEIAVEVKSEAIYASGNPCNNRYHFLLSIKNGKIIKLKEYMDTQLAAKVLLGE